MRFGHGPLALALCACATVSPEPVRYIDAHSHVLPDYTLEQEVALFREAGLGGFVLMHPDEATLRAARKGAEGYVSTSISLARLPEMPGLRLGPNAATTMSALIDSGETCGFGEIPTRIMPRTEPDDALALLNADRLAIYSEADARGLPVNMHVDISTTEVEAAVARIAQDNPRARIVLAHAGWSAEPAAIERLMSAHSNVMADLSVRLDPAGGLPASPLPPGGMPPGAASVISILQVDGSLRPEWRSLMERYPDRFLFAMDITDRERPRFMSLLLATARMALASLGPANENAIAHGNLERLFSNCRAGFAR